MECTKSGTLRSGHRALRRGRCSLSHHAYRVTSVTLNRSPLFRDFMLGRFVVPEMKCLHEQGAVNSLTWVVMPDHVHWLFVLQDRTLSDVIKRFKARSFVASAALFGSRPIMTMPFGGMRMY